MPDTICLDNAIDAPGCLKDAPVALMISSGSGVIGWANAAAGALFGRGPTDLVGCLVTDVLPVGQVDQIAGSEGTAPKALAARKADGTQMFVEARASRRHGPDGDGHYILSLHDVTRYHDIKAQLDTTLDRMEFALISAKIGVFEINPLTGWSTVSPSWMKMMGVPDNVQIDTQKEWMSRMHPEDLPMVLAADKACINGTIPRSVTTFRMLDPDGQSWRWMRSGVVVALRNEAGQAIRFIRAQTDITEQVEAEEALQRSNEEFRSAFDDAPIGKAIVGLDGRWLRVNAALCNLLGYSEEYLLQTDFQTLTHPDDLEKDLDQVRSLIAGEGSAYRMEKRYFRFDETVILAELSVGIVRDDAGTPLHFVSQIVDVTEQRGLEQMKGQFVANVSHELRTPLTSILGALGLLASMPHGSFPDEVNRLIYIAEQNAVRLRMRVNDILDFEGFTTGRLRLTLAPERIVPLLEKSVSSSTVYAERHGVTITMERIDRNVFVAVDADRLEQVMTNLLSNAAKFATKGTAIRVGLTASDDRICVHVSNDGPNIPDRYRTALFKPFSQIAKSAELKREGTGLGLSICKQIVEQMGGRIGYESADGTTTFWFTLQPAT